MAVDAAPINVAPMPGSSASQSTTAGSFVASLATNNNTGDFTHTLGTEVDPSWQVDLGVKVPLHDIVVHNRDSCCGSRLRDITVEVLDHLGASVYTSPLLNPENDGYVYDAGPETIELDFEHGRAVALKTEADGEGQRLSPGRMMRALNKLGGEHGIGRVDMVENRFVGMKSRGVYETPGGAILHSAHRHMESITMDREMMHLRDSLIPRYAEMVYNGYWYAPEREALQALVSESQRHVTGTVRLKLYKGNITALGRKSAFSLYQPEIATMEADEGAYDQADAAGFIRLNALRLQARAQAQGGAQVNLEHNKPVER